MATGQSPLAVPHGPGGPAHQIAADAAAQIGLRRAFPRVFLLSPARIGGARSHLLMRPEAAFELAVRLRNGEATLGEVYAFISGLYFRGKVAYSQAFGGSPAGTPHALVIVPGIGLVPAEAPLSLDQLHAIAQVPVDAGNTAFCDPFRHAAAVIDRQAGPDCRYILLGSIATEKYTRPLLEIFGERLLFPEEFIGRGDMSRGGLMLRCARGAQELSYVPVHGAVRHGRRPPKLHPERKRAD